MDVCCLVVVVVLCVLGVLFLLDSGKIKVKIVQQPPQKVYIKICPKCKTENENDFKYCKSCGEKF